MHLKILNRKYMFQRLPIELAQVKAGNSSRNSRSEICQIIYSLHREKKIDTTFMNFENSKTSDPHRLILNLTNRINLRSDKYVAFHLKMLYF